MLKTLTLSLSLAVALGYCSVSLAGGGCSTCGIASPQGPAPSAQASPQGECAVPCAAPKGPCFREKCHAAANRMSCGFKDFCCKMKPKAPVYTYEWVLKKKKVHCRKSSPCGQPACETCGVMPTEQGYASPQGYSSPQGYAASPQAFGTYGSGQGYAAPSYGTSQNYGGGGSGQLYATPTSGTTAAPARGDEAPPAPEVPATPGTPGTPAPTTPAPPAPPATSGLLFSTPSGY